MSNSVARWLFGLAAAYNFGFGVWAALFPSSFFSIFDLEPTRYPSIWACVGMVVGLYGIVYAYVAWQPDRGDLFVWIGLTGKVIGPIGWLFAVWRDELPPRTFPLILANDLIWWFPFLFYLLRRLRTRRMAITWLSVAVHLVACSALVAASGGTEVEPDVAARSRWVAEHTPVWTATWFAWSLATMSLLAFMVTWGQRLIELAADKLMVFVCCTTCAVGVLADLAGETIYIVRLTQPNLTVAEFTAAVGIFRLLSVDFANLLYCIAGLKLTDVSERIGFFQTGLAWLGAIMWIVGLVLTGMGMLNSGQGQVICGAALMGLFIPWATLVGWRLR